MEKWVETTWQEVIGISLTAVGIYVSVILFTRIAGKRSFSKMSSFDFAMTVAVGSIIATTVLSASVSLISGIAGLAAIYILQILAAVLRRYTTFHNLIDNTPLLLMNGSEILYENLRKARVTEGDLRSKLRESNVLELKNIKAVVFETTGNISVIHSSEKNHHLNSWLLQDVTR